MRFSQRVYFERDLQMGSNGNGHNPLQRLPLTHLLRGRRRVAFVLSGGGSLGALQVGMLQALFDAGIRPNMLVGTSVGAEQVYVLPIGCPWRHEEPSNALGMARQALARLVEQRVQQEISMFEKTAEIYTVPAMEPIAVSPADFSHTNELIERGYASAV